MTQPRQSRLPRPRVLAALAALALIYAVAAACLLVAGVPALGVAVLAAAVFAAQWMWTERLARRLTRAQPVSAAEEPELHAVVDRLCALTHHPRPRLAISPDPAPNAWTVGRSADHTTIIVTRALLRRLDPSELTAVLAHEVAHIAHRDVSLMTLISAPALAMTWFARTVGRGLGRAPGAFFQLGFFGLVTLAAAVVAGLLGALSQLPLRALSRARESAADATAAAYLGQPALLSSALLKLHEGAEIPRTDLRAAVAALGVIAATPPRNRWLATHPSLETRLADLARLPH
ncbi:M48 family metalloprotease [Bailinhaonella thermotolerans]|uniref:Zinc metalloprotease HtpX n=1 Tax=Bailinhaonella thermotolerans TaxID=1070861 RepID=A0A3A4B483_9ACTN|nr:M48 family metalloprotease [Bailinhaonella thermotolerans]RJL35380.1 zinc metalloprotease HtpX [Bailinhaonella thermotolerans]